MSSSTVSLHQTLNLLDHADALRQAEVEQRALTRAQLTDHLQTVSASLGHPLSEVQARRAVDNSLAALPLPKGTTAGSLDRPATMADWENTRAHLQQTLAQLRPKFRRLTRLNPTTGVVGGLSGFVAAFGWAGWLGMTWANHDHTATYSHGMIEGQMVVGLFFGVVALIYKIWGGDQKEEDLKATIQETEAQQQALEPLPPEDRPGLETLQHWCEAPGNLTACHQVLSSPVPFLWGDQEEMRRRYLVHSQAIANREMEAQEAQQRTQKTIEMATWDNDVKQWLLAQVAPQVSM